MGDKLPQSMVECLKYCETMIDTEYTLQTCIDELKETVTCDEGDIKIETLENYRSPNHYTKPTKQCGSNGWELVSNSCWIDSLLYAMFASNASEYFTNILGKMHCDKNKSLRELASYISTYLENINKKWDSRLQKFYKIQIAKLFTDVSIAKLGELPSENYEQYFQICTGCIKCTKCTGIGCTGMGQYGPILNVFKNYSKTIKIETVYRNKERPNSNTIITDIFTTCIEDKTINLLIININNDATITDDTTLSNILNFKSSDSDTHAELCSIINGIGAHFTSIVKCNDRIYYYDNNGFPKIQLLTVVELNKENNKNEEGRKELDLFNTYAPQLTLMYKINRTVHTGGNGFIKSSKLNYIKNKKSYLALIK
jgi:hypothetical protein